MSDNFDFGDFYEEQDDYEFPVLSELPDVAFASPPPSHGPVDLSPEDTYTGLTDPFSLPSEQIADEQSPEYPPIGAGSAFADVTDASPSVTYQDSSEYIPYTDGADVETQSISVSSRVHSSTPSHSTKDTQNTHSALPTNTSIPASTRHVQTPTAATPLPAASCPSVPSSAMSMSEVSDVSGVAKISSGTSTTSHYANMTAITTATITDPALTIGVTAHASTLFTDKSSFRHITDGNVSVDNDTGTSDTGTVVDAQMGMGDASTTTQIARDIATKVRATSDNTAPSGDTLPHTRVPTPAALAPAAVTSSAATTSPLSPSTPPPFLAPALSLTGPLAHIPASSLISLRPPSRARTASSKLSSSSSKLSASTKMSSALGGAVRGPLARAVRDPVVRAAIAQVIAGDVAGSSGDSGVGAGDGRGAGNGVGAESADPHTAQPLVSLPLPAPHVAHTAYHTHTDANTDANVNAAFAHSRVLHPCPALPLTADLLVPLQHRNCVPVRPAPHVLSHTPPHTHTPYADNTVYPYQDHQQHLQGYSHPSQHHPQQPSLLLHAPARREPATSALHSLSLPSHVAIRAHTYTRKHHVEVVRCVSQPDKPHARTLTRTVVHVSGDGVNAGAATGVVEATAARLSKQVLAMAAESVVDVLLATIGHEDTFVECVWPAVKRRVRARQVRRAWEATAQDKAREDKEKEYARRQDLSRNTATASAAHAVSDPTSTTYALAHPQTQPFHPGQQHPQLLHQQQLLAAADTSPRLEDYTLAQRLAEQEVLLRATCAAMQGAEAAGCVPRAGEVVRQRRARVRGCGCAVAVRAGEGREAEGAAMEGGEGARVEEATSPSSASLLSSTPPQPASSSSSSSSWGDAVFISPDVGEVNAGASALVPAHVELVDALTGGGGGGGVASGESEGSLRRDPGSGSSRLSSRGKSRGKGGAGSAPPGAPNPSTSLSLASRRWPLPLLPPPLTPAALNALAELRRLRVRNTAHMLRQADAVVAVFVPQTRNNDGSNSGSGERGDAMGMSAYPLTVLSLKGFFTRALAYTNTADNTDANANTGTNGVGTADGAGVGAGTSSRPAPCLAGTVYPLSLHTLLLFPPRALAASVAEANTAKRRARERADAARGAGTGAGMGTGAGAGMGIGAGVGAGVVGDRLLSLLSRSVCDGGGSGGGVNGQEGGVSGDNVCEVPTSTFNAVLTSVATPTHPSPPPTSSSCAFALPEPACALCSLDSGVYSYLHARALAVAAEEGERAFIVTMSGDARVVEAGGNGGGSGDTTTTTTPRSAVVTVSAALEAVVGSTPIVDVVSRRQLLLPTPPHATQLCECASVGCAHACALWEGVKKSVLSGGAEEGEGAAEGGLADTLSIIAGRGHNTAPTVITTNSTHGNGSGDGGMLSAGAVAALRRMGVPVAAALATRTNTNAAAASVAGGGVCGADDSGHSAGDCTTSASALLLPPLHPLAPTRTRMLALLSTVPAPLARADIAAVTDAARAFALQALVRRSDGGAGVWLWGRERADVAGPEEIGGVGLFEVMPRDNTGMGIHTGTDTSAVWVPPATVSVTLLLRVLCVGSEVVVMGTDWVCGDRERALKAAGVGAGTCAGAATGASVCEEGDVGEEERGSGSGGSVETSAHKGADARASAAVTVHLPACIATGTSIAITPPAATTAVTATAGTPTTPRGHAAGAMYRDAYRGGVRGDNSRGDVVAGGNKPSSSNSRGSGGSGGGRTNIAIGAGRTIAARIKEFTRVYTCDMIRYRATRMLTNAQCVQAEGFNTPDDKHRYWRHFLAPHTLRTHANSSNITSTSAGHLTFASVVADMPPLLALPAPHHNGNDSNTDSTNADDGAAATGVGGVNSGSGNGSGPGSGTGGGGSGCGSGVSRQPVCGLDVSKITNTTNSHSNSSTRATLSSGSSLSLHLPTPPSRPSRRPTLTLAQAWHEAHLPPAFLRERERRRRQRAEALAAKQGYELQLLRRAEELNARKQGKRVCVCNRPLRIHVMSCAQSIQFWLDEALTRAAKQLQRYHGLSAAATAQAYLEVLMCRHREDKQANETWARQVALMTGCSGAGDGDIDVGGDAGVTRPAASARTLHSPRPRPPPSPSPAPATALLPYQPPDPLAPGVPASASAPPRPSLHDALHTRNVIPYARTDTYASARVEEVVGPSGTHGHRDGTADLPLDTPWHVRQALALHSHVVGSHSLVSALPSARTHAATASVHAPRPLTFSAPLRSGLRNSQPLPSSPSPHAHATNHHRARRSSSAGHGNGAGDGISARGGHSPPPVWERSLSAWRSASTAALAVNAYTASAAASASADAPSARASQTQAHTHAQTQAQVPVKTQSQGRGHTPRAQSSSSRRGSLAVAAGHSRRLSGVDNHTFNGTSVGTPPLSRRSSVAPGHHRSGSGSGQGSGSGSGGMSPLPPSRRASFANNATAAAIAGTYTLTGVDSGVGVGVVDSSTYVYPADVNMRNNTPPHTRTLNHTPRSHIRAHALAHTPSQQLLLRGTLPATVHEGDEPGDHSASTHTRTRTSNCVGVGIGWSGHRRQRVRAPSPPPSVTGVRVRPMMAPTPISTQAPAPIPVPAPERAHTHGDIGTDVFISHAHTDSYTAGTSSSGSTDVASTANTGPSMSTTVHIIGTGSAAASFTSLASVSADAYDEDYEQL